MLHNVKKLLRIEVPFVCSILNITGNTVRPRDTRAQAALTLQVQVFELGPKNFELNEFM